MLRNAMSELLNWKSRPNRKPLLIRGARQVGKTWLMREFGRAHFAKTAYINFDDNERMAAFLKETWTYGALSRLYRLKPIL